MAAASIKVAKPPKRRRRARSASAIARSASAIARSLKSGQLGKPFRPEHFAELTTPAAPFRNGYISLMARPPLLFKEGNRARFQFIHTFIDRAYSCARLFDCNGDVV